jgi:hypothetical protein
VSASGDVVVAADSYKVGRPLSKLGFVLDRALQAWKLPRSTLVSMLPPGASVDLESILALASTLPDPPPQPRRVPHMLVEQGQVQLLDAFPIKDQLRALGFSYAPDSKAWVMSETDFETHVGQEKTMEALRRVLDALRPAEEVRLNLAKDDALPLPSASNPKPKSEPLVEMDSDGMVHVHNSYRWRGQLKELGFRFEGAAWSIHRDALQLVLGEVPGTWPELLARLPPSLQSPAPTPSDERASRLVATYVQGARPSAAPHPPHADATNGGGGRVGRPGGRVQWVRRQGHAQGARVPLEP